MSRRPLEPLEGEHDRRAGRMAPGGRLRSEAPRNPIWKRIGSMGDNNVYVAPSPPEELWISPTSEWIDGDTGWMGDL